MTAPRFTNAEMAELVAATLRTLRARTARVVIGAVTDEGAPVWIEVRDSGETRVLQAVGEPGVVRCIAPRRPLRFEGDACGGFVGRFARPVRVIGLLGHSDLTMPGHDAVPCSRCGFLHEIAPAPEPEGMRVAA